MPEETKPKPGEPGWKADPGDPVQQLIGEVWANAGPLHPKATTAYLWYMKRQGLISLLLTHIKTSCGLLRRLANVFDHEKMPAHAAAARGEASILETSANKVREG